MYYRELYSHTLLIAHLLLHMWTLFYTCTPWWGDIFWAILSHTLFSECTLHAWRSSKDFWIRTISSNVNPASWYAWTSNACAIEKRRRIYLAHCIDTPLSVKSRNKRGSVRVYYFCMTACSSICSLRIIFATHESYPCSHPLHPFIREYRRCMRNS